MRILLAILVSAVAFGQYTPPPGGGSFSLTLTTTGTSGAATYTGGVLNIPIYSSGGGSCSGDINTACSVVSGINGGTVPASGYIVGTNSSNQIVATALTSAHIIVGNGSNLPANVAVSGDLTLANTGAFTVVQVNGGAIPASAKLTGSNSSNQFIAAALTSTHLYVGNGSNLPADVAASGDVSLANTGAFTVTQVQGAAVPASASILATNSSRQLIQATAPSVTGIYTTTQTALGATPADGFFAVNTTAAANGAQQYGPCIHMEGQGWGTTASTSQAIDFRICVEPVQGAVPFGNVVFQYSVAGGAYSTYFTAGQFGNMTFGNNTTAGTIISGGYVQVGTASQLNWGATRDEISSPANGQLIIANSAGTGSGLAATGTGDVSACYSLTSFQVTQGSVCGTSLAVYKQNVEPITHGLDYVMQMKPVTFDWREDSSYKARPVIGMHDIGMVADELAAIDPLLGDYDAKGLHNFRDRAVLATLVKAVQQIENQVQELQRKAQ